ncbi:MAG: hypothetical protein D8H99_44970 [Streptococcus sp.]|nr:MAG: hypothetical protein D8H99_44970 [Streptococcus sp.]
MTNLEHENPEYMLRVACLLSERMKLNEFVEWQADKELFDKNPFGFDVKYDNGLQTNVATLNINFESKIYGQKLEQIIKLATLFVFQSTQEKLSVYKYEVKYNEGMTMLKIFITTTKFANWAKGLIYRKLSEKN